MFRFNYLFLSETYEPVARGTFLKSWIFSIEAWIQMTFFFKSFFFFAYKFWNLVTFSGSSHYSDSPFLRPPIITTAHFSDNPLFRQPITPTMTNIYINFVIFLKSGPGAIKHENFLKYERILNCHGNVEMLIYNWLRMKISINPTMHIVK